MGVSLDGEEGHASASLDLAERQSVPVINLLVLGRDGALHSGVVKGISPDPRSAFNRLL